MLRKRFIPATDVDYTLEAELLKVIAHPLRLRLLDTLRRNPSTVKELWTSFKLPQATVSQHLSILKGRGVVVGQRKGNTVVYSLSHPLVSKILSTFESGRNSGRSSKKKETS